MTTEVTVYVLPYCDSTAVRKPFPLPYDNGQNSHLPWGATRTGRASKNLPLGLASTRAQTLPTHHHHHLLPHTPWLHLHLKLPKAGSASKTWSCILLAQVPAMSSTPTFSTFKSHCNTIKYIRVEPLFRPTLLAGSLPCTLALSSAQNTPTKALTTPPGHPGGPSNCLTIYARARPLHRCPVQMIHSPLPQVFRVPTTAFSDLQTFLCVSRLMT